MCDRLNLARDGPKRDCVGSWFGRRTRWYAQLVNVLEPAHSALSRETTDPSGNEDTVTRWGTADDGAVVEIAVPQSMSHLLGTRWPPRGLKPSAEPPHAPAQRVVFGVPDGVADLPDASIEDSSDDFNWDRVESELAIFAAERLDGLIAVHAAVIVWHGWALVLPGTSGAGKSTLSVEAVAAGAQVLTDEYALVDPRTGWVSGWLRPLRVRRSDGTVDRLDIAVASDPVPVGLVAMLVHNSEVLPNWAPITGAEAALSLLANTVCAQSRPDESLDAALAIARSSPAVGGFRGEASATIVDLLALMDQRANENRENE